MAHLWLVLPMLLHCLLLATSPCLGFTSSEQGVKQTDLTSEQEYMTFTKSLYKMAQVMVHIVCPSDKKNHTLFRIGWLLRQSPCAEEYSGLNSRRIEYYYEKPEQMQVKEFDYKSVQVQRYTDDSKCLVCDPSSALTLTLPNLESQGPESRDTKSVPTKSDVPAIVNQTAARKQRRKRAVAPLGNNSTTTRRPLTTASPATAKAGLVTRTWEDGVYLFVLRAVPCCKSGDCDPALPLPKDFRVSARIEIVNPIGYLSAIDWPLLPFFGSMCLLYLLFGLLWLGLCARYWREMLRIQFCISGVIFLGMLEKALFYAEYQSINTTGVSVQGAVMLAELVSCVKRSVARMLVLIVCLGYGIVKPRLGQLQHKVIAIGLVYFVFSAIESSLRAMRPRFNQSRNAFYATIPLAVTDAIICWWIFSSLVQTIRNLRVRRNLVKLSLYRHFTNTLVFCVVCSVVFMAWTVGRHKFAVCVTAWRELWIDDAFWHLLFSVILFVIIILWRPSQNNQRYAFTPLLDVGEDSDNDDDEEVLMDNLAEGVKARGTAAQQQLEQRSRHSSRGAATGEDSLRWVEENIPQSLVESTLPSLLHDSDEEVLTTKYEMSKLL